MTFTLDAATRFGRALTAAVALLALAATGLRAADDGNLVQLEQNAFRAAVDRIAPSVVGIETVGGLERVGRELIGTGPTTGLIVDPDGFIISSAFNFVNRPTSILVRLSDGTRKVAKLVATDHNRMIVLLKIEVAKPLPVGQIAPQDEIQVGQWAIAVGKAFEGGRPNMAVGVVSALGRVWGKAIQTDAAISPNNYGGPLVDIRGRVLGVLVPLSPQSETEVSGVDWYDSGIGFAVPAYHVQNILPRLKKGQDLSRGLLGISFTSPNLQVIEPLIAAVQPKSPAAAAGFKSGDRIVEIEGRKVQRAAQVREETSRRYAGDKVRVVVLRGTEKIERQLELVSKIPPFEHPYLGILPMRLVGGDKETPAGVEVRYVFPDSPAAAAGIQAGDVLRSLDGAPLENRDDLRLKLVNFAPDAEVKLEIKRGRQTLKPTLKLARLEECAIPAAVPPANKTIQPDKTLAKVGKIPLKVAEMPNDAWAYVPENYDATVPHGVVLWLHGWEASDADELIKQWKPVCETYHLILLTLKATEPAVWQSSEADLCARLIDKLAKASYTLDSARMVAHGYQGGASQAYLVAFRFRNVFRAVAAVEGSMHETLPDSDPMHRLAFYVAKADRSPLSTAIEDDIARLREMKYPVTVKNLDLLPRYLQPAELGQLAQWIDLLDRL